MFIQADKAHLFRKVPRLNCQGSLKGSTFFEQPGKRRIREAAHSYIEAVKLVFWLFASMLRSGDGRGASQAACRAEKEKGG